MRLQRMYHKTTFTDRESRVFLYHLCHICLTCSLFMCTPPSSCLWLELMVMGVTDGHDQWLWWLCKISVGCCFKLWSCNAARSLLKPNLGTCLISGVFFNSFSFLWSNYFLVALFTLDEKIGICQVQVLFLVKVIEWFGEYALIIEWCICFTISWYKRQKSRLSGLR